MARQGRDSLLLLGSFENFTESARRALTTAQAQTRALNHSFLGTEHLLLGVVSEDDSVAVQALIALDVRAETIRERVRSQGGGESQQAAGDIALSLRVHQVIQLAVDEAARLAQSYIGTEHLLLGILREDEGNGAAILRDLGVGLEPLRRAVVKVQSAVPVRVTGTSSPNTSGPKSNVVTCRLDDRTLDALDMLVEAGVRPTRSDAAAWLIGVGLEANSSLLERISTTVAEIRRLRQEAQTLASQENP